MLPRVAARPALQHGIIATPRAPSTGFRLEIAALRVFVIFLGAILNQPLATLGVVALEINVEEVRRILIFRRPPLQHEEPRGLGLESWAITTSIILVCAQGIALANKRARSSPAKVASLAGARL